MSNFWIFSKFFLLSIKNFLTICVFIILSLLLFVNVSYCEWTAKEIAVLSVSIISGSVLFYLGYLAKDAKDKQKEIQHQSDVADARQILDDFSKNTGNNSLENTTGRQFNQYYLHTRGSIFA